MSNRLTDQEKNLLSKCAEIYWDAKSEIHQIDFFASCEDAGYAHETVRRAYHAKKRLRKISARIQNDLFDKYKRYLDCREEVKSNSPEHLARVTGRSNATIQRFYRNCQL